MIRNGQNIATGTELSTQVCIIGSGPAGITAAWELQKAGIKVILIEGSREFSELDASWPDKSLLYGGKACGLFENNERDFLILPKPHGSPFPWERERIYGGTSNHWGGQCRPQDPIDLKERSTNFPGWPITRADLDPYYARASELMVLNGNYEVNGVYGENFSNEYWANLLGDQVPVLEGFDVEMYQFVGEDYKNFAKRNFDGKPFKDSAVDVILNASLLTIDHQQGSVSKLHVASMDDTPKKATEFTITADAYVLACGAVANARQLLLSEVGNDLVGRYFMCHPLSAGSVIDTFLPLDPAQADLMLGYKRGEFSQWYDKNGVWVQGRFIPNEEQTEKLGIGRCWFLYENGLYYFEMAPNPDSRVTLLTDKDCPNWSDPVFNQNLTKIDWELSQADEDTYNRTTALFTTAVENLNGTVTCRPWDDVKNQLVVNGHHMGTTRMSVDSEKGVVDPNLKMHSLNNLYVAGASVFSSAGISNPTFTIIALSIRLADHLTKVL